MSRFADPSATAVLVLPGGCQCPGSPHEADEWTYRTELGDSEQKRAAIAGFDLDTAKVDWIAAQDKLIEVASVRWNLVDDDGDPVELSVATIRLLDQATRDAMAEAVDAAVTASQKPLPNASAARSPSSSRASGGRTRTARKGH